MDEQKNYIETQLFRKRQVIFREGDMESCMYVVDEGRVAIVANYGEPGEKVLTEIDAGGFFGEMGMVRGFPRSATAIALESDTRISTVTWETLSFYFKQSPAKVVGIMQQMSHRIESLSIDFINACGAVEELSRRCTALMDENKRLRRGQKQGNETRPAGTGEPLWQCIPGEEPEEQDECFKRYIEEYMNYKNMQKRMLH